MVGHGGVVPARTSPTLYPPSPPTVHQLSRLALYKSNANDGESVAFCMAAVFPFSMCANQHEFGFHDWMNTSQKD